jgi:hypothetical protein
VPDFEHNVFINCPFDEKYVSLLRPLIFTILYLGLNPRIALERKDSSETRISKIISLIKESKYSIHDLSRLKAKKKGEYFRLNMPFELGLDVGCKEFKPRKWKDKKLLILEEEPYRYQAAISDLSNSDIAVHRNEPEVLVEEIRNWFSSEVDFQADSASKIWGAFLDFMKENYDELTDKGFSKENIENLPMLEFIKHIQSWLEKNQSA